ncbi:MAG: bifunctional oligoribonuclease/PAP phosphatase NrnA [Chloroflexota bacterium]|jgi:bifunctional oligoribonuclease and PAP phosphatase NrnA
MDTIKQAITNAQSILIVTHVDPDGDAIGSLTAVGNGLAHLGKQVTMACDDNVPGRFRFLPLTDKVQKGVSSAATFDLMIALDCGDESRMGRTFADLNQKPPLINIDHHVTNTNFGQINLVDAQATSTTEILYELFIAIGIDVTADIALSLLTGLVTDTLGFRTVGVTPRTMKITSALMAAGADLSLVTMLALNLKPMSTIRLWQLGLNNLKLDSGLVWTSLTYKAQQAIGFNSPSSAGLVNMLANVEEAAMSAVLLEQQDGSVRVGFRCRPPYSVSEVALNLGGGGHPLAAGCSLDGPLAKAESLVVGMCKESIAQQSVNSNR